jgi:putative transposase
MAQEVTLRQEAVRRFLAGESKVSIGKGLGKSRFWVHRWVERYDPDHPAESLQDRSSAPRSPHREWPEALMKQVVSMRQRRVGSQEAGEGTLIGAEALHFELQALGMDPIPPVRTIHYWLKQAGLIPAREPDRAIAPRPICSAYPQPERGTVNELQPVDLKGPIYLANQPQKHYLLALRDFASKGVAVEAVTDKQGQTMVDFLVSAWQRRGLPAVLQMDNAMTFRGNARYPRSFSLVVKVCLDLDVEPLFVPPAEPWRNGFIENFNGLLVKLLLDREHFADVASLQAGARKLEQAVNTSHRLAALDGQTPNEFMADKSRRFPPAHYDRHQRDDLALSKGFISFIRMVRKSGRITLIGDDKFDIDPDLKWHYVLARVDVAAQTLSVYHADELLKSFDYLL